MFGGFFKKLANPEVFFHSAIFIILFSYHLYWIHQQANLSYVARFYRFSLFFLNFSLCFVLKDEHAANLKLEQEREAEAEALRQKQVYLETVWLFLYLKFVLFLLADVLSRITASLFSMLMCRLIPFSPCLLTFVQQISGRKKAALQSQIFVVTATYRRTQSELNALIVEVTVMLLYIRWLFTMYCIVHFVQLEYLFSSSYI